MPEKDPPIELTDHLLMLGTNPYPLYLFKGQREGAIFEGGIGPMGPLLREQIERLAIDSDFVKQVVITHAHPDHVMAVPLFREMFPTAIVLASEPAAKTLSVEKAISFFCKIDDALTGSMLELGLINEQHRRQPLAENRIAVDRVIKEGDTITIDGISINVLETPGHSECSLSFHQPDEKILLVSDASGYYVPEHHHWWPMYFSDYDVYLSSIERLAALGAEVLCLSHNAVIRGAENVKSYFRDAISATRQYHRRIVDDAQGGKPAEQIAEQLGAEVYQKTQLLPLGFFQKNCKVLVKMSLRREGINVDK